MPNDAWTLDFLKDKEESFVDTLVDEEDKNAMVRNLEWTDLKRSISIWQNCQPKKDLLIYPNKIQIFYKGKFSSQFSILRLK